MGRVRFRITRAITRRCLVMLVWLNEAYDFEFNASVAYAQEWRRQVRRDQALGL